MRQLSVLLLFLAGPAAASPALLGATGNTTWFIDRTTGQLTAAADPAGAEIPPPALGALATEPRSGTVHALDLRDVPAGMRLDTLDATGHVTSSVAITYLGAAVSLAEGLAFSPEGRLWVTFHWTEPGSYVSGNLGVIDPVSGVIAPASVVPLTGGLQNDGDTIEFVGNTLYLADSALNIDRTTLFMVDTATGVQQAVGDISDGTTSFHATDLAWDGKRLLAEAFTGHEDPGTGQLIEVRTDTAEAAPIGPPDGGLIVNGLALVEVAEQRGGGDGPCVDPGHRGHRKKNVDPQPCHGVD